MIASNYSDLIGQVLGQLADEGLISGSVLVTGTTGWIITMDDRVSVSVTCRAGRMSVGDVVLGWFWGDWAPALGEQLRTVLGAA